VDDAALLHDEAVAGAGLLQRLAQDLLGLVIGLGDEVAGPLGEDLQVFDLAEVALQRAGRLHHGVGHHGHQRGADHSYLLRARGRGEPAAAERAAKIASRHLRGS